MRKSFEIIDHTADVGIRAFGEDLCELYANAAHGMLSLMVSVDSQGTLQEERVVIEAEGANLGIGQQHRDRQNNCLKEKAYSFGLVIIWDIPNLHLLLIRETLKGELCLALAQVPDRVLPACRVPVACGPH